MWPATRKLAQREREIVKHMQRIDIERIEMWRQEFQKIEQKRNDFLPEHQQMQRLLQKLQSLQDKNCSVKRMWAGGLRDMNSSELKRKRRGQK